MQKLTRNQKLKSEKKDWGRAAKQSVILVSRDWILRLVPLLLGRWENYAPPQFAKKIDGVHICEL